MHEMSIPMMHVFRTGCCVLLGALLWSAVGPVAAGQDDRTLTIRDGTVYVDGQQLSTEQMPDGLDLSGVTARYQFRGVQQPVIELNGRLFTVENGLKPMSADEVARGSTSVLRRETAAPAAARASDNPHRQYLDDVQEANRELYERLVRERKMERKAQTMAQSIRSLSESDGEHQKKVDSLRTLLNDIFELKQDNRRLEVERLQRDIQELQRRLRKRKEMRTEMIDRRLDQLLGATRSE